MKQIEDATLIRRRMLLAFEHAETACDESARRALLNFVVVGAGPTGVELAGAIAELARRGLGSDFRNIDPRSARVILVEAGPRVLSAYPETLSAKATKALERLGVEVRLNAPVTRCDADGVELGGNGGPGERIPSRCVIWAAGVMASPAARWLGTDADRAGRVRVAPDLSVPGHPEVFVIGDTALVTGEDGRPVPGIAPAAKQMGAYVAKLIGTRIAHRSGSGPFHYRHLGSLATIGRGKAIADFGWLRASGSLAWWLWGLVHVYFLIGFRNRLAVMLDWAWSYVTWRRGARLITGKPGAGPA